MDSIQAFPAPACAQATSAKPTSASPSKNAADDPGFAEVLVQSTEQATARAELVAAQDHPSAAPGQTSEKEDETEILRADGSDAADLAALIAQVTAECLPSVPPAGGKPSAEIAGIALDTKPSGDKIAGAAPFRPGQGSTAEAAAIGDPAHALPRLGQTSVEPAAAGPAVVAIPSGAVTRGPARVSASAAPIATLTELAPASDEPPESFPALPAPQVTGSDLNAPRVRATSAAGREGLNEVLQTAGDGSSPITQQIKPAEFRAGSIAQKTEELRQPVALPPETPEVANLMAGATTHAPGAHNLVPAGPTAITLVPTHIESPAWSKDFGQHVIRLAVDGQPAAEIHLNPPNLGPIRVSIEIKGQEAMLQFVADHPQTREALENALPRLREMFAAGSLTLTGANVTGDAFSSHAGTGHGQRFDQSSVAAQSERLMAVEDVIPAVIAVPRPPVQRSRIDLFA